MARSVVVLKDKDNFKVMVCFVQRGVTSNSAKLANSEAKRIAKLESITNIHLYEAEETNAQS
jgi:hypothetical protein